MAPRPIIVCLGLALQLDGSMHADLSERCKVAAKLNKTRSFPIINTGGDPIHVGITEARAMTDFMVTELGVDEKDIFLEEKAGSTEKNAQNTLKIMERKKMDW